MLDYPMWAGTGVCRFSGGSRQRTAESGERIAAIVMPSPGETAGAKILISLPTPSPFSSIFSSLFPEAVSTLSAVNRDGMEVLG